MCVVDQFKDVYVILYPSPLTERNVAKREVDFVEPRCKITNVPARSPSIAEQNPQKLTQDF